MEEVRKITQAYDQAPWRKQLQLIAVFLLGLVILALIAGIYLNVTAQAATAGRQIQEMQIRMYGSYRIDILSGDDQAAAGAQKTDLSNPLKVSNSNKQEEIIPIEELRIQIANLESKLAMLTSEGEMHKRALAMGFVPSAPETEIYIKVPGYLGRQTAHLAPPPSPVVTTPNVLSPAYRESLIDWLTHQLSLASRRFSPQGKNTPEVKP